MTDKDGYKSVDYSRLTPILVEAIKEQQKKIDELQLKISGSTSENEKLKSEMLNLKTDYDNRLKLLEQMMGIKAEKK